MIGYPTESYGYGTIILWYSITGVIPFIVACVYYIPLIHRLNLTSVYEVTHACRGYHFLFQKNFSNQFVVCTNDTASFNLGYFVLNSTWSDASTKEFGFWNLL